MRHSFQLIVLLTGYLLFADTLFAFDRQDTLRGSNGHGRDWWDVQHYFLQFDIDTATRTISGVNTLQFKVTQAGRDSMQIDLQQPMVLDSVLLTDNSKINFVREGHVYWLHFKRADVGIREEGYDTIRLFFHGKPREAVKPPWDGGFIWGKDSLGNPWISVACQGLGASSWWPCKDYQGDEPDSGMYIKVSCSSFGPLVFKSNGRDYTQPVTENKQVPSGCVTGVKNPINTYNVTFYLGDYIQWADTFQGMKGILNLNFSALRYNESKARRQFKEVKKMLEAFEYWFGPYPFYEDGYQIVEAPFLGMEHQSAIAYGNKYQNGYLGKDRSGTGVGLLFDFIIVHESGHEWFGNSITAADIADNWIHEGFTTYSETLFTEYWFGKKKAFEYTRGEWSNIVNDKPVCGQYGVQDAGSGDKYDKGSALVHTIRLLLNDDKKFRAMLHKINDTFYHKQISTAQMEEFITGFSGLKLQPIFNQYLRSSRIPELQWRFKGTKMSYRLVNIADGFELPLNVMIDGKEQKLPANALWQTKDLPFSGCVISFPPEFLIRTNKID